MSENPTGNESYAFKYGVHLNMFHKRLYLYSDVDYTYIGDMMAETKKFSYGQSRYLIDTCYKQKAQRG